LKEFINIAEGLPYEIKKAGDKLKYTSVYVLNIGIDRVMSDKHWVYFPEKQFPFYRVGIASNFSKHIAPQNASALYIETAVLPGKKIDTAKLEKKIFKGLKECGFLKSGDKIMTKLWRKIDCGYVIYDSERTPALNTIFDCLKSRGIYSIGRYGAWKYSFMEEAVADGKKCAEEIIREKPPHGYSSSKTAELTPLK